MQMGVAVVVAIAATTWSLLTIGLVGTAVALWLSPIAVVPAAAVWSLAQSRRASATSLATRSARSAGRAVFATTAAAPVATSSSLRSAVE